MYSSMTSTRETKTWMTILLFANLILINVEGQTGNAEEDLLIFRALEKALLTEKNLYVIQNQIYIDLMRNSYSNVFICQEDFVVKNISHVESNNEDDDSGPAFQYNEICNEFNCYERVQNSYVYWFMPPCEAFFDNIRVSNPAAVLSLSKYIENCLQYNIAYLDISFFQLLAYFTDLDKWQSEDDTTYNYDIANNISLIVDNLPVNITENQLKYGLQNLFKWYMTDVLRRAHIIPHFIPRADQDKFNNYVEIDPTAYFSHDDVNTLKNLLQIFVVPYVRKIGGIPDVRLHSIHYHISTMHVNVEFHELQTRRVTVNLHREHRATTVEEFHKYVSMSLDLVHQRQERHHRSRHCHPVCPNEFICNPHSHPKVTVKDIKKVDTVKGCNTAIESFEIEITKLHVVDVGCVISADHRHLIEEEVLRTV